MALKVEVFCLLSVCFLSEQTQCSWPIFRVYSLFMCWNSVNIMQISKGIFTKQAFQNQELPSDQTRGTNLREDEPASKALNSTLQHVALHWLSVTCQISQGTSRKSDLWVPCGNHNTTFSFQLSLTTSGEDDPVENYVFKYTVCRARAKKGDCRSAGVQRSQFLLLPFLGVDWALLLVFDYWWIASHPPAFTLQGWNPVSSYQHYPLEYCEPRCLVAKNNTSSLKNN